MGTRWVLFALVTAAVMAGMYGCPKPPEPVAPEPVRVAKQPHSEPVTREPGAVDISPQPPGTADQAPAKPPEPVGPAPTDRASFEKWNVATSRHTPRNDDETAAVAELTRWLVEDAEVENMVLLPAPDHERKDMPGKYYEWYESEELTVYLFVKRAPDRLLIRVGPPEACSWGVMTMVREDGKWVVEKAVSDDGPEEVLFYQRGKGFIETEE